MRVGLLWVALLGPDSSAPPRPQAPIVETVDIRWSAPEACPGRTQFVEAIEELVGHRLHLSADAEIVVDGRITPSEHDHVLRLEMRSRSGTLVRELHQARCGELVAAGSLVVVAQLSAIAAPSPATPLDPSDELEAPAEPAKVALPPPRDHPLLAPSTAPSTPRESEPPAPMPAQPRSS
ncbi:MAG: hypothetical protein KDK70_24270, partial [Myxococcales bacterium]|nr:hypothetical protein [Myxococcales bacterium]